jgi:hypothetical protein
MNRWRFASDLPPGSRRLSMMFMRMLSLGCLRCDLTRLLDPHVPLDQAANLPLGIARAPPSAARTRRASSRYRESFFDPNEITGSRSSTC